jgi:hypothetical protein
MRGEHERLFHTRNTLVASDSRASGEGPLARFRELTQGNIDAILGGLPVVCWYAHALCL